MTSNLVDSKIKIVNSISRIVNALNIINNNLQNHDIAIQEINEKFDRQNSINNDIYQKLKTYELATQMIYDNDNNPTSDYILYLDKK